MNAEWLNWNENRKYPFRDTAVYTIPDNAFLDISLSVPHVNLEDHFLNRVVVSVSAVTVIFSNSHSDVASVIIPIGSFEPKTQHTLNGLLNGVTGQVVLGDGFITMKDTLGLGTFNLNIPLEYRTVKNSPYSNVLSINGLVGDVKLAEGFNIEIAFDPDTNTMTLGSFPGAGKGIFCGEPCQDTGRCSGALYTINGMRPDSNGRFTFFTNNGVQSQPGTAEVEISVPPLEGIEDCERSGGDPGDPGPTGPAGAGGSPGYTPTAKDCDCWVSTCPACQPPGAKPPP